MKYLSYSLFLILSTVSISLFVSCNDDEYPCTVITWYQDADDDGLENPDITLDDCDQPDGYVADNTDDDSGGTITGLHPAFAEFDTISYTIVLDGDQVIIKTNGLPNHTSPYWSNTTERYLNGPMGVLCTNENTLVNHPLFSEPELTSYEQMAPGNIDDFNGSYSLTVPVNPELANGHIWFSDI